MDYVNKAERAKMILCRIDDPQAVEVGNSLGINLYQGRYIQRMLNAQPRRTIFRCGSKFPINNESFGINFSQI